MLEAMEAARAWGLPVRKEELAQSSIFHYGAGRLNIPGAAGRKSFLPVRVTVRAQQSSGNGEQNAALLSTEVPKGPSGGTKISAEIMAVAAAALQEVKQSAEDKILALEGARVKQLEAELAAVRGGAAPSAAEDVPAAAAVLEAAAVEEEAAVVEAVSASGFIQWPVPGEQPPFWTRLPAGGPVGAVLTAGSGSAVTASQADGEKIHIVHITAEMAPLAKVGGLGDVVTGLGRASLAQGHKAEACNHWSMALPLVLSPCRAGKGVLGAGPQSGGRLRQRAFSPAPLASGNVPTYQRLRINLDLEVYRAKALIRAGKLAAAEELMRKAIVDWPDDGRPYVILGRLLSKQRRAGAARAVYEQGCQALGGDNAYIWQCWAVLEERLGNTARARKLFDAATAADERHAAAWHGWAMLELRAGNRGRARQLLEKGAKCCGESAYIYQSLAVLAVQSGRLSDARALFLRCTQLNPRGAASWLAWALLEANQQQPETARVLFEKALESSPKSKYVWQAWGVFEASQGRLELARKLLTRGCQLHPKDPVMLQSLALLEYNCGFCGTARELFREAAAADPTHQPVWNAWGWMEWKEARVDVARTLFQKSIDVDSNSPGAARALQAWGVLEEREGNLGIARTLFRKALQADPDNDVVWKTWVAMEEREGNAVRADQLRSLYQQQRVEVVETSWDLSSILTPALDTMKAFFMRSPAPAQEAQAQAQAQPQAQSLPLAVGTDGPSMAAASRSSPSLPVYPGAQAPGARTELGDVRNTRPTGSVGQPGGASDVGVDVLSGGQGREAVNDFDADAFIAQRLPKTYQKIMAEESAKERSIWRRPMSAEEMRRWKDLSDA